MTDKELTPWQRKAVERRAAAHVEGRTYFTGRCNCYGGHGSNSGRCYEGQGGLFTYPEREGVCDSCWEGCGHREHVESTNLDAVRILRDIAKSLEAGPAVDIADTLKAARRVLDRLDL